MIAATLRAMSLSQTEYVVQRVKNGKVRSTHGPYETLEAAQLQKRGGERIEEVWGIWRIMERDVTEWTPVPTSPPDMPEED